MKQAYKLLYKKIIAVLLSVIVALSIVTLSGATNVNANSKTIEIKCSILKMAISAHKKVLNNELSDVRSDPNYESFSSINKYIRVQNNDISLDIQDGSDVILDVDTQAHIPAYSLIDGNLSIKGDYTLFIDGSFAIYGNVTLESGAKIAMNKSDSCIYIDKDYDVIGKHNFDCYGLISVDGNESVAISCVDDFNLRGGTIKSNNTTGSATISADTINIYDGNIEGVNTRNVLKTYKNDINFYKGTIDLDVYNFGMYSANDIYISGGKVNISNQCSAAIMAVGSISINDSEVYTDSKDGYGICSYNESVYFGKCYYKGTIHNQDFAPVVAFDSINFAEDQQVTDPAGAKSQKVLMNNVRNDSSYMYAICTDSYTAKTVEIKYVPKSDNGSENGSGNASGNNSNNTSGGNTSGNSGANSGSNTSGNSNKYSNEWVNGKWYNANGVCDYAGTLQWKCNDTGWWVEDSEGWYPVSQWQKIDGKWYYFTETGYMDYSEYRDGYWLGADGALVDGYYGEWKSDSTGWWFEDISGWYPVSQWVWINGSCYYFEASGYLATNKYVDGYWVGADGACN